MERIASNTMTRRVLFDNQRTLTHLADLQLQLSSGKRINAPSDDPTGLRQGLLLRASSSAIDGYTNNIDRSNGFLQSTDVAFASATEVITQVRSIAVQGGNDTLTPEARQALAASVDSALTRLLDVANTTHDGRFVFSGTATTTKPFSLDAGRSSATYQGTSDPFTVEISPTSSVAVSHDGFEVFQKGTDAFAVLAALRDALQAGDGTAVRAMISDLDSVHRQVTNAYGALGSREKMLEMVSNQLAGVKMNLDEQASQVEDADLTQVITEFTSAQTALEAGLHAGGKVMQMSLLDFLR
jgi:flagellar hook-associated protein 3 FlgL